MSKIPLPARERQTSFEKVFRESYRNLFLHAFGFVKDEEVAKDIVNDVFLFYWENPGRVDEKGLYLLVRNACFDFLRHRDVEARHSDSVKLHYSELYASDYAEFNERVEKAMKHVEKLPPMMQTVFKECFLNGLSYKAVAEKYGISVNTVRNHIAASLKTLRKDHSVYFFFF